MNEIIWRPHFPFVRKVLVFATEKGIDLEVKAAFRDVGGDEWFAASPFRKIPALVDGDYMLCDSSAIIAYLDTLQPEPNLIPVDAKARGKTIWFEEFSDTILFGTGRQIFYNRVVAPLVGETCDEIAALAAERDDLPAMIDYIEGILPASGFLVEDRLTLADIAVTSPFVNIGYCSDALDPARWPKTSAYVQAITARPAYQAVLKAEREQLARQQAGAKR